MLLATPSDLVTWVDRERIRLPAPGCVAPVMNIFCPTCANLLTRAPSCQSCTFAHIPALHCCAQSLQCPRSERLAPRPAQLHMRVLPLPVQRRPQGALQLVAVLFWLRLCGAAFYLQECCWPATGRCTALSRLGCGDLALPSGLQDCCGPATGTGLCTARLVKHGEPRARR